MPKVASTNSQIIHATKMKPNKTSWLVMASRGGARRVGWRENYPFQNSRCIPVRRGSRCSRQHFAKQYHLQHWHEILQAPGYSLMQHATSLSHNMEIDSSKSALKTPFFSIMA